MPRHEAESYTLETLLGHCRAAEAASLRRAEQLERRRERDGDNPQRDEQIGLARRAVARWKGWGDAVAAAIAAE